MKNKLQGLTLLALELDYYGECCVLVIRRKTYSGDRNIGEKKKMKRESEMDGLSQSRHESYRGNKR